MDQLLDLIIVGSGPAGMTAAIYAKRAGLEVLVFEGSAPGGKLVKTHQIDNWPGQNHIGGVELAMQMYNHTNELEIPSEFVNVTRIDDGEVKTVIADDGRVFKAKAVILASGTVENKMNIPGEDEMTGKGVSFCAVCDGAFYRDRKVVVIGGGNSALEEAIYLTQFAKEVVIVIRRDVFRADQSVQDHVLAHPKIRIIRKHIPLEVVYDTKVSGIKLMDVESKEVTIEACDGVFPYIGSTPSTKSVAHLGITDPSGYLIVDAKMATKIPGLYGAGDVVVKPLRQIVTAVNDGAVAAQMVFHYIKESYPTKP